MTDKNFANGIVIKQTNEYYLRVGIKRDEFINWLNSLEASESGWVNATIGKKKNFDQGKPTHYMCEDNWKPERQDNTDFSQSDSGSLKPEVDDNDDLPF